MTENTKKFKILFPLLGGLFSVILVLSGAIYIFFNINFFSKKEIQLIKAPKGPIKEKNNIDLSYLNDEVHLKLIKSLTYWPKVIEASAIYKEPHRVAFYLIELSSNFHSLWSLGRENNKFRFFQKENEECTYAYLSLIKALKIVISSGLNILSVSAPEEM